MRIHWVLAGVLSTAGLGCKDNGGDPNVTSASMARVQKLQSEEGEVLARRDDLKREREKVAADRAALAERRRVALASGGDIKALDDEEATIMQREGKLLEAESAINAKIDTLIKQYQEVGTTGGAPSETADVARREGLMASREKDVARREDGIARRESELASRERSQAQREKETCGVATTTIVQTPMLPKGSKYSRRDVEPMLQKARRKMSEKGLLSSDLPAAVQGLERDATEAMADADYGKAKLAADQLYATVDAMRVDRSFVVAKINRLNSVVKSKPIADTPRREVDDLFRGATLDYGDGKFNAANSKLNKIYALVR